MQWTARPGRFGSPGGMAATGARVPRDAEESAASDAVLRAAFEHSPTGMSVFGLDGEWLRVNDAYCGLLGHQRAELLGGSYRDVTHPDDVGADREFVADALAGRRDIFQREKRYVCKDGSILWALTSGRADPRRARARRCISCPTFRISAPAGNARPAAREPANVAIGDRQHAGADLPSTVAIIATARQPRVRAGVRGRPATGSSAAAIPTFCRPIDRGERAQELARARRRRAGQDEQTIVAPTAGSAYSW